MISSKQRRIKDIEQQIAQLRWERSQKERLIKSALETTKSLKTKDAIFQLSIDHAGEKALWQTAVVKDELSRPLVLSDSDMHKIQFEETLQKEKVNQVLDTN